MSQQRSLRRKKDRTMFAREIRWAEGVPVGWANVTGTAKQRRAFQRMRGVKQRNARLVVATLINAAGLGPIPHTLALRVPTKFQQRNELARMQVMGDSYTPSLSVGTPEIKAEVPPRAERDRVRLGAKLALQDMATLAFLIVVALHGLGVLPC